MLRRFSSVQILSFFKPQNAFATAKKGTKAAAKDENAPPEYNIFQALRLSKAYAMAAFDETIEVHIKLNVNPKHGDQVVRGSCTMPFGLGKSAVVAVYTSPENQQLARDAGADIVFDTKQLDDLKNGPINFEKLIATPEVMANLKPLAKTLGPKGLMPNTKVGSLVTADKLEKAIKETKMGSVTFRVDQGSVIHAPLGKASFVDERLTGNLKSLMQALIERKPASVKGSLFLNATLSSTMGPGWKVNLDTIDPRNKNCAL